MRAALASLPWVEPDSVKVDADKRQARFTVKDRGQFNLQAVADVLKDKGYDEVTLLVGPTDK